MPSTGDPEAFVILDVARQRAVIHGLVEAVVVGKAERRGQPWTPGRLEVVWRGARALDTWRCAGWVRHKLKALGAAGVMAGLLAGRGGNSGSETPGAEASTPVEQTQEPTSEVPTSEEPTTEEPEPSVREPRHLPGW